MRRLRVASRSRAQSRRARQKRVICRKAGPVGGTSSHRWGKMVSAAAWRASPRLTERASARAALRSRPVRLAVQVATAATFRRSEEHTSELQSLMRISYAVFCLKKKNQGNTDPALNSTIPEEHTYDVHEQNRKNY